MDEDMNEEGSSRSAVLVLFRYKVFIKQQYCGTRGLS